MDGLTGAFLENGHCIHGSLGMNDDDDDNDEVEDDTEIGEEVCLCIAGADIFIAGMVVAAAAALVLVPILEEGNRRIDLLKLGATAIFGEENVDLVIVDGDDGAGEWEDRRL